MTSERHGFGAASLIPGVPQCFKRAEYGVRAWVHGVRKGSAPHHRPGRIKDEQGPLASP